MAEVGKISEVKKRKAIDKVKRDLVPVSDANPHIKVLVYGRSGHGKTRFAASGPKTIVVDINEKGTRSIRGYENCFVYRVSKWEQLSWVYWYLREGNHDFETVVIDTLTQAQALCLKHVLMEAEDRDPNRPASLPRRQDWGQMGELMKPMILNYRNLEMNVVFVCQERIDRGSDEDEEATNRKVPDLSPSVRGIAMASVEIMGRIYRAQTRKVSGKGTKRKEVKTWTTKMLVGPHDDFETKDRTGRLGRIVVNPTMEMMIEAAHNMEDNDGEED